MTTPLRTCVVCRTTKSKTELIRLVQDGSGKLIKDEGQVAQARAIYTCPACYDQLSERHLRGLKKDKNVRVS